MATKQVQIRRDTASNLAAATPTAGELGWNTTDSRLYCGDGASAGGIPIPNWFDAQAHNFDYADDVGAANAYEIVLLKSPSSLKKGVVVYFIAAHNNTTSSTLKVNAFTAKNLYKLNGGVIVALDAGDIITGMFYAAFYDGTKFILMNSGFTQGGSGGTKGWNLLAIGTPSSGTVDFSNIVTSDYDQIAYILEALTPGNTSTVNIRGQDSGGTWNTSSIYYTNKTVQIGATVTPAGSGVTTSGELHDTSGGTAPFTGMVMQYNCNLTADYHWFESVIQARGSGGVPMVQRSAIWMNAPGALSGLRFYMPSGVGFTSGKILAYGIKSTL